MWLTLYGFLRTFKTHTTHTYIHIHNEFPDIYFKRNHPINHVEKIADYYSGKQAHIVYF